MTVQRNRRAFASLTFAAVGLSAVAAHAEVTLTGKDDGVVEVTLPDGWEKLDMPASTGPNVQLMAVNKKQDTGMLVAVEDRADLTLTLAEYADRVVERVVERTLKAKAFAGATKTDFQPVKVNDNDALRCEIRCTIKGVKLAYLVTIVQTEKNFQNVEGWATQSKFEKAKPARSKLADGAKELKPAGDK